MLFVLAKGRVIPLCWIAAHFINEGFYFHKAKYAYLRVRIRVPILRGGDGAIHLPVTLLIPSRGRQEVARGGGRARL